MRRTCRWSAIAWRRGGRRTATRTGRRSARTTATCRAARGRAARARAAPPRGGGRARVAELERPRRGGLGGRVDRERGGQAVGQLGARGEHVADPEAGHRVRLGERAEHQQVGQLGDEAALSSPGSRKSASASSSSTQTRSPTRSHSARTSVAGDRGAGRVVGARERDRARVRADAVGERADASPATGTGRPPACRASVGQRAPARPRHEQLAAARDELRARVHQQLGGAVADRDPVARQPVALGGELAHLASRRGRGRRSCAAAARRWRR